MLDQRGQLLQAAAQGFAGLALFAAGCAATLPELCEWPPQRTAMITTERSSLMYQTEESAARTEIMGSGLDGGRRRPFYTLTLTTAGPTVAIESRWNFAPLGHESRTSKSFEAAALAAMRGAATTRTDIAWFRDLHEWTAPRAIGYNEQHAQMKAILDEKLRRCM